MDSSIVSHNGIEIYKTDIDRICDEYIDSLAMPEMIYSRTPVFIGLLDTVYKAVVKPLRATEKSTRDKYELLDKLFYNVYLPLCYRFNKTPTIQAFCMMVRIDNHIVSDLKEGIYRENGEKVNVTTRQTVKGWYDVTESVLLGNAVDNNSIGSIFGLKALYNYSDQNPVVIQHQLDTTETPQNIVDKYKTAKLPEKIDV